MRITDFGIGKARRRYAHDARVLITSLRLPCHLLTRIAADNVRRSGRDYAKAERRIAHISSVTSNFNALSEEQCLANLRFRPAHIPQIVRIINWEGPTARCGYTCDPVTAVCIFLRRLAYPTRWIDLESEFGMRTSKMSDIFWEVAHKLFKYKAKRITGFRGDLLQARCSLYARAISDKGGYLNNCVGFIDGTKISMCRPGGPGASQRANYSGHERHYCLGYQTVTAPDGLILHIFGPTEGRQLDSVMYARSGIDDSLRENLLIEDKQLSLTRMACNLLSSTHSQP